MLFIFNFKNYLFIFKNSIQHSIQQIFKKKKKSKKNNGNIKGVRYVVMLCHLSVI